MLTRADFFEASAINALICSSLLFSPSNTTLEIKVVFKASESVGKSFKEKTPKSFKVKSFCFADEYRLNLWGSAVMETSVGLNAMDGYTLITLLPLRIIVHKNQSSKFSGGARKAKKKAPAGVVRLVERKTQHKEVAAALDELNIVAFQNSTVTRNHAWPCQASRKGMRIGMRRDV